MPQRLRLPAAVIAAIVVAEAAVLLLRPKERYPVVEVEPRAYFSTSELQRAVDFRSGQLWLFGARTAVELAVLIGAVRYAPRLAFVVCLFVFVNAWRPTAEAGAARAAIGAKTDTVLSK